MLLQKGVEANDRHAGSSNLLSEQAEIFALEDAHLKDPRIQAIITLKREDMLREDLGFGGKPASMLSRAC